MSPIDPSKALATLLKRLKTQHGELLHQPIAAWLAPKVLPAPVTMAAGFDSATPVAEEPISPIPAPTPADEDPLLQELVYSFLLWDATTTQARTLMRRLSETFVDSNELRVCLADELAEVMGDRYPRAWERSQRLRAALQDLYKREHGMRLTPLSSANKRDIRGYLDSLDGIPPFVAARVFLVGFGGHAVPCDARLADLLADEGVIDAKLTDPAEIGAWLERQIRAAESLEGGLLFQAWSDEKGTPPKREKRPVDPYGLEDAVREARAAARSGAPAKPKPPAKSEHKAETKSDPKPETKPETKAEAKSDAKASPRAGKPAPKPAGKSAKTTKSKGR